jgi:hypothetical protein
MQVPNVGDLIKPWQWNYFIEGVMWFVIILLVVGTITWTRAGKDRKHLPDQLGRNVEDFAGIAQESNGPVPTFLFLLYLVVGIAIISYIAITSVVNYNY